MTEIGLNFKPSTIIRLLCLSIGFTVIVIVGYTHASYADLPETHKGGQNLSFFSCEKFGIETVRCDPSSKKTEGYEIAGTSSKIYEIVGSLTLLKE